MRRVNLRNPTEHQGQAGRTLETAEHRNVYCGVYTLCLDKAIKQGWNDWTCQRCPSFAATTKPSAASYAQARRYDE